MLSKMLLLLLAFISLISPALGNFPNGTYYFVDHDCRFKSANQWGELLKMIERYTPAPALDKQKCGRLSSAVYRTSTEGFERYSLVFARYESPTELSISIQPAENGTKEINLDYEFLKANYEHALGKNCRFDNNTFSIGVDSDMLYTVAKCDGGKMALMRSVLSPSTGEVYTPSNLPLIPVAKDGFDKLAFLPVNERYPQEETLVLRMNTSATGKQYQIIRLREVSSTQLVETTSTSEDLISRADIFGSYWGMMLVIGQTGYHDVIYLNGTEPLRLTSDKGPDPPITKAWGFFPTKNTNTSVVSPPPKITWKVRVGEKVEMVESDECKAWIEEEKGRPPCQSSTRTTSTSTVTEQNAEKDMAKNESSTPWFLYLIFGILLVILLATLGTLLTLFLMRRKKGKSKVVSKEKGPAVTAVTMFKEWQNTSIT